MNKKLLTIFLISSIAISSMFAVATPSVILLTDVDETSYNFKLQKISSDLSSYTDLTADYEENVTLDSTERSTDPFAVATANAGNLHDATTFTATVTTGEFKDDSDVNDIISSGFYPMIDELSDDASTANDYFDSELVTYSPSNAGNFTSSSVGTFSSTFTRGIHEEGVEIGRFKLKYKANDNLVAGSYSSTTTIEISTN